MSRYSWQLLRAGPILLDGGGMFGCVPRVVWSRRLETDDLGRIALAHNCLLLTNDDPAHPHRIVIETGSGDKFGPKMRNIFGLTDFTVASAVKKAGVSPKEIAHVVVSHLHFDHAGGLTRTAQAGETPDWVPPDLGSEDARAVKLTFPKARVIVQRREWEDAVANRSVMTRTYLRENLEPLRDHLRLIESPPPFTNGKIPNKNELPPTATGERESEILPGLFVFLVPGHTWGQQAIRFVDPSGQSVVFVPDVLPTVHHVGAAYSLAYDVEPYTSSITRHWLLQTAAEEDWLLVLDHEPGNPCQRVRANSKGWYDLVPEAPIEGEDG